MVVRAAKAIIIDKDGDVLVVRRSDTHPYVPLTPDLPGGKIEDGETVVEGLLRELREEIGLEVAPTDVKEIKTEQINNYFGKDYQVSLYELRLEKKCHIQMDFEHDMYEWIPLAKLQIVGDIYVPLVEYYKTMV